MKSNKFWAASLVLIVLAGAISVLGAANPDTFGRIAGATGLLTAGALIFTALALRRKDHPSSAD